MELFFADDAGPAQDLAVAMAVEMAKAVCADCPVRARCLSHAISTPEEYGIWGGLTGDERRDLLERVTATDT